MKHSGILVAVVASAAATVAVWFGPCDPKEARKEVVREVVNEATDSIKKNSVDSLLVTLSDSLRMAPLTSLNVSALAVRLDSLEREVASHRRILCRVPAAENLKECRPEVQ